MDHNYALKLKLTPLIELKHFLKRQTVTLLHAQA